MVWKTRPRALPGLVTKNHFSVLVDMDLAIKELEAAGSPDHGTIFQISPVKTRIPERVTISKEAAHFFLHTIRSSTHASPSGLTNITCAQAD